MRHSAVLLGALLLFLLRAGAQVNASAPMPISSPSLFTPVSLNLADAPGSSELPAKPEPAAATSGPAVPQEIPGVYGDYSTQIFLGYTFFRFYEIPSTEQSLDGVELSMAYYMKPWVAADLEAFDAIGTSNGKTTNMFVFGAGPRLRWQMSRGMEFWGHALGGFAHYSPNTIYGYSTRGAWEAGGGVDFGPPHRRWGYRVQADAVGTFLFGVHQISPRVAAGIVLKF